ncbi:MAG: hypothetical protein PHW82_14190, partial [Bacteroidales bacterium]|nr:hypothetical protein [Bacteroidales bacterium]
LEQIKIANPNIIIFGNVLDLFENDLQEIGWDLKQAKKFTTDLYSKFPIFYQCEQNRVIVDAYHPACRRSYKYYYTSIIEGLKSIF